MQTLNTEIKIMIKGKNHKQNTKTEGLKNNIQNTKIKVHGRVAENVKTRGRGTCQTESVVLKVIKRSVQNQ